MVSNLDGFCDEYDGMLAGIYKHARDVAIYADVAQDVDQTTNHELTHLVLAISTTAGFIHQLLAFLAYQASTPRQDQWRHLYLATIARARVTHEAAAIYCSLDLSDLDDHELASAAFNESDRNGLKLMDGIRAYDCPSERRLALLRTIPAYAMNPTLRPIATSPYEELLPPVVDQSPLNIDVDDRFRKILRALESRTSAIKELMNGELAQYDTPSREVDESIRSFLIRRRRFAGLRERAVRKWLTDELGSTVAVYMVNGMGFKNEVESAQSLLKTSFRGANDKSIEDFTRDIEDDSLELNSPDPMLFNQSIVAPKRPLAGIQRLPVLEALRAFKMIPDLIELNRIDHDQWLSDELFVRSGQFYTRIYAHSEDRSTPSSATFYTVSDSLPVPCSEFGPNRVIWRTPPLESLEAVDLDSLEISGCQTGYWLTSISFSEFETLLAQASQWSCLSCGWENTEEIITIAFSSRRLPISILVNLAGVAAQLVLEEVNQSFEPTTDIAAGGLVSRIFGLFPFTFWSQ